MGKGFEQQIGNFLTAHPNVGFVIVDTLQRIRQMKTEGYSYGGDYEVMTSLKTIADRFNITILVVHHTRKEDSDDSFNKISGTNGLLGCADGAMVLQNIPLGKLTTTDIQKFYNRLLKPPDGSPGICPKTIKNTHGVLSKAMSVAVVNGYIRSNPCVGTILPRVEKHEVQPLTDDQVALLLQQAEKDEEYGLLLKVILLTGVRKAEAMGITWDCVDFRRGVIHINKQLQKRPKVDGGVMFTSSKNGKGRVLKPAPYVMELMKKRYEQQIRQKENASVAWRGWQTEAEHRTALAFTTLFGTPLQPQTVYNHFKKIAVEIGAPNAKVHDLRHTYAVLSLQNGDDVKTVQGNLGHATAAFTLDVYGHVSEAMKTASANRMEEYVRQIPDI